MSSSGLDQEIAFNQVSCMDPYQESSSNAELNLNTTEDPSNVFNSGQDEDNERESNTRTPDFVNIVVLLFFMIVGIPETWWSVFDSFM